jgi:hypothetical protein
MKRTDFTCCYNSDSYTVSYKGEFLYGAGVKLPRSKPLHWRHRRANVVDNKIAAERIIEQAMFGLFPDKIKAIDKIRR